MISRHLRIHALLIFTSIFLIVMPAINKIPNQQISEQTLTAATKFLFLVDTEEYLQSWETTSSALKNILSRDAWHEQIAEIRSRLGPIIGREQQDISYTRYSQDVPEGEYVVLTFLSRFQDRAHATETLTLKLGTDKIWRVAGYYVRYGEPTQQT
jgi:hypothetical protein